MKLFTFGFGRRYILAFFYTVGSAKYMSVHARDFMLPTGKSTVWLNEHFISAHAPHFRSVYIAVALILWSFTLAEDPDNPIDDTAFVPGIVSQQKPFSLVFTPRMSEASLNTLFSSTGVY